MNTINEVKMLAAKKGMTITKIAEYLSEKNGKKYTIDGLSKKLRADTIRYSEIKLIFEAMGCEIIINDK